MSYELNPYYNPSALGLEPVAELEVSEPDYSFDIVMVWRHTDTGKLYGAADSGCSCPSPFEDYTSLETLTPIHSVSDADALIFNTHGPVYGDHVGFISKVRKALR